MEIAIGMMSVALTLLGVILVYIWRSNGKIQLSMMEVQKTMMEAQKTMMNTLLRIEEGQRQGFQKLGEGMKYLADLIVLEGEKTRGKGET